MISPILNALGLMKRSEHERIVDDLDMQAYSRWRDAQTELDKLDAKFKLAATDLAKQAEAKLRTECQAAEALNEIEHLKAELRAADNLASGYQADALLWRNARDKRSRNRRGVKTNG